MNCPTCKTAMCHSEGEDYPDDNEPPMHYAFWSCPNCSGMVHDWQDEYEEPN